MSKSNQGGWFEEQINHIADAYRNLGIMEIEKVEPPLRVVGKRPNVKVIFMANPFLDYVGSWTAHRGRAVFIEAKSTAEPKLPLASSGGVSENQVEALLRWNRAGAAVGVIWGHASEMRFVPLQAIQAQLGDGVKHVKWGNATPIPQGHGFVLWDFARVLARYYPEQN